MKNLLILIIPSILLLISPLFGQETGVLYQYRTSTGLQWKTFGDGKVQPKYEGEIIYGEPNGHGIYTNPDGRKYVGKFKDGEYHGQGTYISPDRDMYVGEFSNGKLNGQGTYTWSDGNKYVGGYKDGNKSGQGTYT